MARKGPLLGLIFASFDLYVRMERAQNRHFWPEKTRNDLYVRLNLSQNGTWREGWRPAHQGGGYDGVRPAPRTLSVEGIQSELVIILLQRAGLEAAKPAGCVIVQGAGLSHRATTVGRELTDRTRAVSRPGHPRSVRSLRTWLFCRTRAVFRPGHPRQNKHLHRA